MAAYFARRNGTIFGRVESPPTMRLLKRYILTIFLLFCSWHSRLAPLDFQYLTVEKDLSSNIVYQTVHDEKGLIWIATRNGIDRYDGTSFRHYSLSTTASMLNTAYCLYLDKKGRIWAGSAQGLFHYDHRKDNFEVFSQELTTAKVRVNALWMDRKDQLWVGTAQGLVILDPENGERIDLPTIPAANTMIRAIYEDAGGDIWVGSRQGIHIFDPKQGQWRMLFDLFPGVNWADRSRLEGICFYEDDSRRLWIGTLQQGIWLIDNKRENIRSLASINPSWPPGEVRAISRWANQQMLIGVDGSGLLVLDTDLKITATYRHDEDQKGSLNDNGIYHILRDVDERYWVSTYGGGLNVYDARKPIFQLIQHEYNNPNSLNNNFVRAILQTRTGNLWFGTEKGLSRLAPSSGSWTHYYNEPGQSSVLGHNTILSICQDRAGGIWAGSYSGGVINIDPAGGQNRIYRSQVDDPNSLGTDYVYTIYEDAAGLLWFGGIRGQLTRYDPARDSFQRFPLQGVFDIIEAANDQLYLGTVNGLFLLDKASERIERIELEDIGPITSNIICFYRSEDDTIWMGTESNGLIAFSPGKAQARQWTLRQGLPSNSVVGILEDERHRIWLSTARGLSCINPKDGSILNFSLEDGIGNLEFNLSAFGKTTNGYFLFGGQNGCTRFDPKNIGIDSIRIPKIFFTDFKLFNRSVQPHLEDSPLPAQIDEASLIQLQHDQNAFSFDFTAINFTNPSKNTYRWRLVGLEDNWSPITSNASAVYTNISPGDYEFTVQASLDGKQWSAPRTIELFIAPPFWQSGWAYLLYLLIGSGLAILGINYSRIRIKERNSMEKIRFFINIAHDLRTPLTLIKAPIKDIQRDPAMPEALQPKLELVEKNTERLHQLMSQLLDFQKAGLGKMEFQVREKDVVGYLRRKVELFLPWAEEKQIKLGFFPEPEQLLLYYDTDKLDKILYNLLSNALKYTPEKGTVSVSVTEEKEQCCIIIEDDGIGIPKEQQAMLFRRYMRATNAVNYQIPGSGVGLMLVYQLVKLHRGKIEVDSEEGAGTAVRTWLPLGKNHLRPEQILPEAPLKTVAEPEILAGPKELPVENMTTEAPAILIIEDHPEIRSYLAGSLSGRYKVSEAANGAEGLRLAREKSPDLIISDVMMPEIDGMSLCRQIKEEFETSHIPVIMLTALQGTDYNVEGLESGADVYLEKPFEIRVLEAYVQNLIAGRQRLRAKFASAEDEPQAEDYPSAREHAFVQQIIAIIHGHIDAEDFSVDFLCREMALSRPVLFRKLKALTGQNIQNFIKIVRLKKAKELLLQEPLTIAEVAYRTGFSNPKYFSTSFRKHFGVRPSEVGVSG